MEFKCTIQKSVDIQKIQELLSKNAVTILVGFPSGHEHVPTLHKNEKGEYEDIDGGDPNDNNPIETADLARTLHFGNAVIPARPFLEEGIESKKKEIRQAMKQELQKQVDGAGTPSWTKIGTMAVGAVEEFVRSDHYKTTVPNSPNTIKWKGSDTPLIDRGDLLNSLTFKVLRGNK